MMDLPADAEPLIPHRSPMRIVDRLLASDGKSGQAEAVFGLDSPFVDERGRVDSLLVLELIAQSYASAKGYEDRKAGSAVAPQGFLVGISKAVFYGDALAGQPLRVDIQTDETFENFYIATGRVFQRDHLVLEAVLKMWLNPAQGH